MRIAVSILVREGKAYLPTLCRNEKHKLWVTRDPVLISDMSKGSLLSAIREKKSVGNPTIRLPEEEKSFRRWMRNARHQAPELKAAGADSWKEFAVEARAYGIDWTENGIILQISKPFDRGSFAYDAEKTQEFSLDTPLEKVVECILEDNRAISGLAANQKERD